VGAANSSVTDCRLPSITRSPAFTAFPSRFPAKTMPAIVVRRCLVLV